MTVTGGASELAVEAIGGNQCDISKLVLATQDNALDDTRANFRYIVTAGGKSILPIGYSLSAVHFESADGQDITGKVWTDALSWLGKEIATTYSPTVTHATGYFVLADKELGTLPGVVVARPAAYAANAALALGLNYSAAGDGSPPKRTIAKWE